MFPVETDPLHKVKLCCANKFYARQYDFMCEHKLGHKTMICLSEQN